MKRKISEKKEVPQTKKPKVEEVFPIETILQNPGFQLISRNIFKYLKLEDFANCRLVSKSWKQFIDEDKYLAKVQFTEVMSVYSEVKPSCHGYQLTPFQFVCGWAPFQIVQLFLDNQRKWQIDVNAQDQKGRTPLHFACGNNNVLVVNQLLNHGLNVTLIAKENYHILHAAALNKDPKAIQAVFESKQLMNIDKNVTTINGTTVFHFAAVNPHSPKPLAYLLKNATKLNLKINQLNDCHENVFHFACEFGIENTVKFLIQNAKKYNIDLNIRDNYGGTPFHIACFYGRLRTVEILLKNSKKHNIDVCSKMNDGLDGQALAKHEGHTDIVKLIKNWKQ